ncbi:MAG: pitrilysin family protein [Rickettsiaceae bacterium]|nr:pitrilysin family protein [Rickettsiaceae bacterium]
MNMTFLVSHLSNNLPVVTYHMPSFRTVAINFIVGVGSRYESTRQEGLSHFLEHMAFKGTSNRTQAKIAEEFDEIGGQFNAYTSKEQTVYYAKVLDVHLPKALTILADIITNSSYSQAEIQKEYGVICQEIAQTQDNPDDLCYENLISTAFSDQPLGKSILGTEDSISKFTTSDFKSYVDDFYTSKNAVLSVAGNIDNASLNKLAEPLFGKIRSSSTTKADKSVYHGGIILKEKELEQSTMFLGFQGSSFKDVIQLYHTQMLSLILGGGLSSRLFQTIREKLGLAYSVGSFNTPYSDNGIFSLYASCSHENVALVLDKMLEEIHKITAHINDQELLRAKEQIKSCIIMSGEKTSYKSEESGKNYFLFGGEIKSEETIRIIEQTETKDLVNIAQRLFSTKPAFSAIGQNLPAITIENIRARL